MPGGTPTKPSRVHIIRITDNGVGIPAEERSRVFAMFERGAAPLATPIPAAESAWPSANVWRQGHGGHIWIEEVPAARGTCVAFALAACVPDASPKAAAGR